MKYNVKTTSHFLKSLKTMLKRGKDGIKLVAVVRRDDILLLTLADPIRTCHCREIEQTTPKPL